MNTDFLFILLPALTVFLFIQGIYKVTLEKKVKAQENIQELIGGKKATGGVPMRARHEVLLKRKNKDDQSKLAQLEMMLERANLLIKPQEFFLLCLAAGVAVGMVAFSASQPFPLAVLLGGGGCFLPLLFLKLKIWMRMAKGGEQFADVLDTMVNCFKTGYGFNRAVQVIADNYDDPWGTEFGKVAMEMTLGATQEDVLNSLSQRMPSPDVDLFVTALLIQKETGGNMAELLGNLSRIVRERYKLFRKVGAISAQGKLSAGIVICVPFLLLGMMSLFLPGPVHDFVTNPIGIALLCVAGVWMFFGIVVLWKMVQIEV
jgi:tight adherence protein B